MDGNVIDHIVMSFVVLDKLLFPQIVDTDIFGPGTRDHPRLLWMEQSASDGMLKGLVLLHSLLFGLVPNNNPLILAA